MLEKRHVYTAGMFVWAIASFGTAIVLYSGNATQIASPSELPGGPTPIGLFGSGFVATAVGWIVIASLRSRSWRTMARRAGFEIHSGLLPFGSPDLTKTVQGRQVRAHTVKRKEGGGGESGSSKVTYTQVEADLAGPADDGLIVGVDGGTRTDVGNLSATAVDGYEVVGPEELARDVLTPRVQNALDGLTGVDGVNVGDAGGALADAAPDMGDSWFGRLAKSASEASVPGDESTVTIETRHALYDADELERRAEAVVAVADAFEDATADGDQ